MNKLPQYPEFRTRRTMLAVVMALGALASVAGCASGSDKTAPIEVCQAGSSGGVGWQYLPHMDDNNKTMFHLALGIPRKDLDREIIGPAQCEHPISTASDGSSAIIHVKGTGLPECIAVAPLGDLGTSDSSTNIYLADCPLPKNKIPTNLVPATSQPPATA